MNKQSNTCLIMACIALIASLFVKFDIATLCIFVALCSGQICKCMEGGK